MTTPAHAFLAYSRALVVVFAWALLVGALVSRGYVWYEAYVRLGTERENEAWLRSKCAEPEFYSNMRQHTELCAEVENRARAWILWRSANLMISSTRVCGERSCLDYAEDLVVKGLAWPVVALIGIALVTVPSLVVALARRALANTLYQNARRTPTMGGEPGGIAYYGHGMSDDAVYAAPFYPARIENGHAKPHTPPNVLMYPTGPREASLSVRGEDGVGSGSGVFVDGGGTVVNGGWNAVPLYGGSGGGVRMRGGGGGGSYVVDSLG
jgi:hypothetical protein